DVDKAAVERSARFYTALMPMAIGMLWLFLHVGVLYLSALIVRASGRMARPRDDIPAQANLPAQLAPLPVLSIVIMAIAPTPLYEASAVLAGATIGGFALVGF